MITRKLLVVTGDYGVVQQVKQVLNGRNFTIHTAYSHLDAVYQLKYELFEVVLVDATMINHKSGEQTALALTQMEKHPPLLIYSALNGAERWAQETVIASLDDEALGRGIARVLKLPSPNPDTARTVEQRSFKDDPSSTSVFWRDEEMQTLFSLARSLTEVLELSEVLNRVVEAARHLTNAEEGMILLPDGLSGQLYLRAKVGIDVEVADNFRIRTHDTIAGAVFESGRPILLGDSGPQKVKTEYFVNSLLYVPIIHKGQTLGVLGVNNKIKHDLFTERHKDLLINLASYAAVAIENARVHGQSLRRAHELKALIDASQAINASLIFDHTLPAICTQLTRVLNVGHAEIHAWDAKKQQLRLLARCQQAGWREGQQPLFRLSDHPAIRSGIEEHRAIYEDDAEQARLKQAGVQALLAIPIFGGEQALGAASAYFVHAPEQIPTNESISQVQRIILEGLVSYANKDDNAPIFRLLSEANRVLGADWIEYMEFVPANAALKLQFAVGGGVWIGEPSPLIDVSGYQDVLMALETQQALNHFQNEDNLPSGVQALADVTGARSLLALPLIGRGQTIGLVLFVDTVHARGFTAREIDLGRAIVGQAATALENSQLVHDLEASLRELKQAQNRLIQAARLSAMGELAAAVAHQINNPLTTIVLDTELLLEAHTQGTKDYDVLSAILRSGKRAAGVVRRLLAMARPISAETSREAVNVLTTIAEVTALVRPHVEREGIRLILRLPNEAPPPILAVPGELDDVWLNLILNAHDVLVGRPSPEIGVTAGYDAAAKVVEVNVWDNGPGIAQEIAGEIFKPFFSTKPIGEGTGLGLHICRQVVDRVGGTISVQTSESGTRFVVRLPIMRSD
ncbi:MAG: GAF domain-containing sensor histidine kinase [Chloroflexota bacterium]